MLPIKRINKLTPEQIKRLPEFRDQWIARGLATGPCDRAAIEAAADEAYRCAGLAPPRIKIWLGSPAAGAIGSAALHVRDQVGAQVWAQVWDQVWAQVRAQVGAQVWAQVWDQVWDQVRDQVGAQVWDQVGAQVWDQVWDQVGAQVRDQVGQPVYGQHDASWLGFYAFFAEVCDLESCNRLRGLFKLAESGWWWPFGGAVILTERPAVLRRDAQGRLHSDDGPAMQYPDGWSIHAVHGVRVSSDIIEHPSSITVERIANESNAEVRRVMIERYRTARYLLDAGAEIIARDDYGVLYRHEIKLDEPIMMVRVLNTTPEQDGSLSRREAEGVFGARAVQRSLDIMRSIGHPVSATPRWKEYMLRVPPTMTTPHEAVAWTFGQTPEQYSPTVET